MKIISSRFSFKGKGVLGKIYRPYLQILITSGKIDEWVPIEMVVDSGADYSLFPKKSAELLGIELEKECFLENTYGVGGKESIYLYKKGINVRIGSFQTRIPVGFLNRDDIPALLGRLQCLELLTLVMKNKTTILEM